MKRSIGPIHGHFGPGPISKLLVSKLIVPVGYKHMRDAKASMLQDLEKDKLTEVDMINGYICAEGRKHGIKTPANGKVVEIVHGIERENIRWISAIWICFESGVRYYEDHRCSFSFLRRNVSS